MFKIKGQAKRRDLDFIDKDKNIIDKVSDFTAFVYPKEVEYLSKEKVKVSEYHYDKRKNQWHFHNILTWEVYITAKKALIS